MSTESNGKGARELLENMLSERFLCECEMVWRMTDEQVTERVVRG